MLFRVDGKPVRFGKALNLANGDAVTLVGYDKGEFEPLVLRNDSTGVVYREGGNWTPVLAGLVFLTVYPFVLWIGLDDFLFVWIGRVSTLVGVVALAAGFYYVRRESSAISMLPSLVYQKR